MALGLCPAVGAQSDARCFLSHLSEVPSPWSLACCCVSAGQGARLHVQLWRLRRKMCLGTFNNRSRSGSVGRGWELSL